MKFNPKYSLSVEVNPDQKTGQATQNVTIKPPFTVEFNIQRNNLASSQTGTFKIYNLGEKTRNLIYKDRYAFNDYRAIQFHAGYDDIGTPLIFNGAVYQAYSERIGNNMVTTIEAFDGGYAMANGNSLVTIGSGSTFQEILKKLNADLPFVSASPILGDFPNITIRGSTYVGNTWNAIVQITGGLASIDNGQLKALNPNEVFKGELEVITSESGLLGSPKRALTQIEFPILFEPRLSVGQIIVLQSSTNKLFNGVYKVTGFTHSGIISESVGGERRTHVSLWKGEQALKLVAGTPIQ